MRSARSLAVMAAGGALLLGAASPRTRCGWIVNPTPGNWWITDRDGEWVLGAQGGFQALGLGDLPDLTTREWVATNGASYGYGCGCAAVTVDRRTRRVVRIVAFRRKPLAQCRADRRLVRPA